jgi:hypothetical protein
MECSWSGRYSLCRVLLLLVPQDFYWLKIFLTVSSISITTTITHNTYIFSSSLLLLHLNLTLLHTYTCLLFYHL